MNSLQYNACPCSSVLFVCSCFLCSCFVRPFVLVSLFALAPCPCSSCVRPCRTRSNDRPASDHVRPVNVLLPSFCFSGNRTNSIGAQADCPHDVQRSVIYPHGCQNPCIRGPPSSHFNRLQRDLQRARRTRMMEFEQFLIAATRRRQPCIRPSDPRPETWTDCPGPGRTSALNFAPHPGPKSCWLSWPTNDVPASDFRQQLRHRAPQSSSCRRIDGTL